jgi:hypothetical protein
MTEGLRTLSVKMSVAVPKVPNYIFTTEGRVPLSALTDEGLRELGAVWTEQLIQRANEQRKK